MGQKQALLAVLAGWGAAHGLPGGLPALEPLRQRHLPARMSALHSTTHLLPPSLTTHPPTQRTCWALRCVSSSA